MVQRKIVPWLLGVAVVLILANILVDKFYKPRYSIPEEINILTAEMIQKKFNESVFNFGLDETYLKASAKKNDKKINVSLPADLPIPLIINELTSSFRGTNVSVSSVEKKINGNTIVELSDDEGTILTAEFSYEKISRRKAGFIGLLIRDMQSLNQSDIITVLSSSEAFAVLVVPSESSKKFSQKIIESRKEYAVLLNDEISELDFKLSEKYSEGRLRNSIRNIVGTFSKAVFFIIDDNSALFHSSIYPFIEKEIIKRGIKLLKKSSIEEIELTDEGNKENLKDLIAGLREHEHKLILTDANRLSLLWPQISSYRKIGYKFINPSLIIASNIN